MRTFATRWTGSDKDVNIRGMLPDTTIVRQPSVSLPLLSVDGFIAEARHVLEGPPVS